LEILNNMVDILKYVKFISKPDQWFKEGTEALYEDNEYRVRRMTVGEYENELTDPSGCLGAVFVGTRVCTDNPNENAFCSPGEERIDGEWCPFDEFEIVYTDEYLEPQKR
jgi:hypothetical protein